MKKVLKLISKIILVISILILAIMILSNIITIGRILLFGMTVGGGVSPDSIWGSKITLSGFPGIIKYYSTMKELFLFIELPICVICIIYQIIYFKIIKRV